MLTGGRRRTQAREAVRSWRGLRSGHTGRMRSRTRASSALADPWIGSRRVVPVRPHLWRWIATVVEDGHVLEVGPGLRPTAPVESSHFVDTSPHALSQLAARGGRIAAAGGRLPFQDRFFGAVLAFEVLEHVEEDDALLAEIARVLRPEGLFILSTPIRSSLWSPLDEACNHVRRYEPDDLFRQLRDNGFEVEGYETSSAPSPIVSRAQARILTADRRIATTVVQGLVFPVQAACQRAFGGIRWDPPDAPVPAQAGNLTVCARLRRSGDKAHGSRRIG